MSELKAAQERMKKAQVDAREIGIKIADANAKNLPTGELDESFGKAIADFEKANGEVQRLVKLAEMEQQARLPVNALPNPPEKNVTTADEDERSERQKKAALREALGAYLRHGENAYQRVAQERQAHLGTIGNLGGYLVTEDFRAEIIKNLPGYAVWRASGARVENCSSDTLVFPSIVGGTNPYSTGFNGTWRPQGAVGTDGSAPSVQNQPTFGQERIPVHEWQPDAVVVSRSLLEDAAVNVEGVLATSIAETLGMDEDDSFLNGDGIGKPAGVLSALYTLTNVNSGSATLFTYGGLMDLIFTLPAQYQQGAKLYMRSLSFASILKLADSQQMPILAAGGWQFTDAKTPMVLGKPVWLSERMPALSGGNKAALYGDPRFYVIAQRTDLRVQRLEERFAPNVGFLPTARLGGGVVRTQAFVTQTIST